MKSISEVEASVNKELQFGRLIHSPIVAWAFDLSCSRVQPVPVAVGGRAQFLKNNAPASFHLIPANPGFFQMAYVAQLRKEHFAKLTAEQRAEIKQTAGTFELGVWTPEDTTDWREEALMCEESTFDNLVVSRAPLECPMHEFKEALQGAGEGGR